MSSWLGPLAAALDAPPVRPAGTSRVETPAKHQVVSNVLVIMRVLIEAPASVMDVCRVTGFDRCTVARILRVAEQEGAVKQLPPRRGKTKPVRLYGWALR